MNNKKLTILGTILNLAKNISLILTSLCMLSVRPTMHTSSAQLNIKNTLSQTNVKNTILKKPDPKILQLAYNAYRKVAKLHNTKYKYLMIVDYTLGADRARLWVISTQTNKILYNVRVAHGIASGKIQAHTFSNVVGSKMSSLGVFVTKGLYYGQWGQSINLEGLEPGFNTNAYKRRIVVHNAPKRSTARLIESKNKPLFSFGCFVVEPSIGNTLIPKLAEGTVIFAYYPDPKWLANSKFI